MALVEVRFSNERPGDMDQRRAPFCELARHVLLTLRLGEYKLHDPLLSAAHVPHLYVSVCQFGIPIIAGLCLVSPACLATTLPTPPRYPTLLVNISAVSRLSGTGLRYRKDEN